MLCHALYVHAKSVTIWVSGAKTSSLVADDFHLIDTSLCGFDLDTMAKPSVTIVSYLPYMPYWETSLWWSDSSVNVLGNKFRDFEPPVWIWLLGGRPLSTTKIFPGFLAPSSIVRVTYQPISSAWLQNEQILQPLPLGADILNGCPLSAV